MPQIRAFGHCRACGWPLRTGQLWDAARSWEVWCLGGKQWACVIYRPHCAARWAQPKNPRVKANDENIQSEIGRKLFFVFAAVVCVF